MPLFLSLYFLSDLLARAGFSESAFFLLQQKTQWVRFGRCASLRLCTALHKP